MRCPRFGTWILVTALALTIAGCGDDEAPIIAPDPGTAFARIAHLSPDAPAVDVYLDGSLALGSVPFRAVSEYLQVPAGDHVVRVVPAGQSGPAVIDATLTLVDGESYTVAAQGPLNSITASIYSDDRTVSGNNAKVRFVHASPDAPEVDITLTDGTILFGAVPFGEAEGSIVVGAGQYDLQVRPAGTETVVLSFGDVPLAAETNYTVFAVGLLADGSLDAMVSVDSPGTGGTTVDLDAGTAELRVAHLSPDAPNVDVYKDDVLVLSNVSFEAVSAYLTIPAATTNLKVYATGTQSNAVIDADATLLPGEAYTIAATGLLSEIEPFILVDDRNPAGASSSHVRFVHTSPDAPAVDIVVAGGPTLFEDTAFRQFAGYSSIASGSYDLEVRLSNGGALALSVPGVQFDGATNYTIFAVGLAGSATLAALPVIDAR